MKFFNKLFRTEEDEDQTGLAEISAENTEDVGGELALDVYETKDNLIIKSTMAGVKPEDLDITIADEQVIIKGERKQEEETEGENYLVQECYWGSFYRAFDLPVEVDVDKAIADIKDGILTLVIPKSSRSRTKKVKIRQMEE